MNGGRGGGLHANEQDEKEEMKEMPSSHSGADQMNHQAQENGRQSQQDSIGRASATPGNDGGAG